MDKMNFSEPSGGTGLSALWTLHKSRRMHNQERGAQEAPVLRHISVNKKTIRVEKKGGCHGNVSQ